MKLNRLTAILSILLLAGLLTSCKPSEEALMATDAVNTAQALIVEQTAKAKIYAEMTQTAASLPPTITPIPSNTTEPTTEPATATSVPVVQQQSVTSGDAAEFVEETIPDGTSFSPGESFTKTWRLKNTGTTTWTTDYQVFFLNGNGMGSVSAKNLSSSVAPGTSVIISLDLIAPDTAGTYEGYWMLRAPSGRSFGTGGNNFPISTVIKVVSGNTSTPTVTPTSTATGTTFTVTGITVTSNIPADGQTCGDALSFKVQANVTVNAAGTVTYRWQYDDGSYSSEYTASFTSASTQTIFNSQAVGVSATTSGGNSGWVIFESLSPNNLAKKYDWTYQCTP